MSFTDFKVKKDTLLPTAVTVFILALNACHRGFLQALDTLLSAGSHVSHYTHQQ